ncbi:AraC family transcriptional regulator [Thioclava sp. A2]|uniref:AraC family transcriptional regulator n=1 Tax=Thioclava sp. FCG-A2 TaxID=3080562 RepID=UPI002955CA2A|nr:AraC family transcriptional regulator [Thioclava sp. A2]MDV7269874.1 AraC family transcriptional regulator [Thioclava sp. A2]
MRLFTAPPLSQFAKPQARTDAPPKAAEDISLETPRAVRIVQLQRLAQNGRWRAEAMRALTESCLIWFTRGQGRITLNGVTRGYGAHNAVFIPAGVMHGFEMSQQTNGFIIYFGNGSDVTLPQSVQHLRIREAGAQSELSAIIDAVQREMASDRPGADRAARHHLGLLGVWLERQIELNPPESTGHNAAKRLVARYTLLLEREFRSGHGVGDFAAELGVTPTHLTRVCRQSCGRGASEMLQERRLYEARRLLSDTKAPVKDIAHSLGFTTAAYFTRAFHAKTGRTPSEFRRGK